MSDEGYTRITLRIPDSLDERLNEAARATSKSKNAEIVARLEASFQQESDIGIALQALQNFATKKGVKFSISIGEDLVDEDDN